MKPLSWDKLKAGPKRPDECVKCEHNIRCAMAGQDINTPVPEWDGWGRSVCPYVLERLVRGNEGSQGVSQV